MTMTFSEASLNDLKSRMPEILSFYGITDLSRNFKSPWRENDRDPSCKYYPDSYLVTDFGGEGVTADAFKLVGLIEGIEDFRSQVLRVCEILKCSVDEETVSTAHRKKLKRQRFERPAIAGFSTPIKLSDLDYMRRELSKNETAIAYLLSRGFDHPKLWRNYIGWVPNRDTIRNDDGSQMFTMYEPNAPHGFIIIPFMDRGATCANYCMLRTIPGDVPPANKELRPTGYKSPLFREWLLSVNCETLYICEGLLDALAMEMLIGKPCLGLGGTEFYKRLSNILYSTPEQLRPNRIILALDTDKAGVSTTKKIVDDLNELGIQHGNFPMPEGFKDPNDLLKAVRGGE